MAPTAMDSWRSETAGGARLPRPPAMPLVSERLAPWLVAAFLVAVLNVVVYVFDVSPTLGERLALALALCSALTAAGLVAARSNREVTASQLEERARPSMEELAVEGAPDPSSPSYVDGMERWATAMLELIEHAAEASAGADGSDAAHAELEAAAGDTRELRELLQASADGPLTINDTATLHALCSLWETNQARVEQVAAAVDPRWHRRWRARTVVERRLRHGNRPTGAVALPYRP